MKLSIRWLSRHVDLSGLAPVEIAEALSMTTAEVEGVEAIGPALDKVVVAEVLKVERHPNADRLVVVEATTGAEPLKIVCGATNLAVGKRVPLALPGAVLPDGTKITKSKIRGAESQGMLCSPRELGLGEDHEGILLLDEFLGTRPDLGSAVSALLETGDHVLSFDNKSLTHRPDLWGHHGMAREIAAIFERPLKPYVAEGEIGALRGGAGAPVPVELRDLEGCRRYSALAVSGVKVASSPGWMKRLLEAVGLRSIDNVVDVTNFVLCDLGQPLHAFDRRHLKGGRIVVRRAAEGERLRTLDGVERICPPHAVMIADAERTLAFAGIMGGEESGISDSTTDVVLESANFDPIVTRRTSQGIKLRTDSSLRFEKSLDPEWTSLALARALVLLREVSPGCAAAAPITDAHPAPAAPMVVETSASFVSRRLFGEQPWLPVEKRQRVSREDCVRLLDRLGFHLGGEGDRLVVQVPSWRATKDVSIPEDIVEEVGRLHGYHHVNFVIPQVPAMPANPVNRDSTARQIEERLRDHLAGAEGFVEAIGYSIANDAALEDAGLLDAPAPRLKNSLSADEARLRISLAPGLLAVAKRNARTAPAVRAFEVGRVYPMPPDAAPHGGKVAWPSPWEERRLGAILVYRKEPEAVFREARAAIEGALRAVEIAPPRLEPDPAPPPWAAPGAAARVLAGGKPAGGLALVSPETLVRIDWKGAAAALFEVSIGALAAVPGRPYRYEPIPKFPPVVVDLAVVADEAVPYAAVEEELRKAGGGVLSDARLFDLYRGEPLPAGRKSLAFTLTFLSANKTLSDKDVEKPFSRIKDAVRARGWEIREG